MKCKNCGADVKTGTFFCANCGMRLETSISKNKEAFFVIIFIFFALFVFFFFNRTSVQKKEELLQLNDISITYDSSKWTSMPSKNTENAKVLQSKNATIALTYDTSDYYSDTLSFAKKVKKYYEEKEYPILEDLKSHSINGEIWYELVYSQDQYKILQLFFSNHYDTYSFVYKVEEEYYDKYFQDAENIYKTLTLDKSKKIQSEKEAKKKLVGEWDWGISGYFVIEEDKIYLYKDNRKSMDNVYYGTYEADNKIKTYATGYQEGMTVLMTLEGAFLEGEKPTLATNQVEFVFVPNKDGTYTIKNLYTGSSEIAEKIK